MKQIASAIIAFLLLSTAAQAQQPNWGPQPLSPNGDASNTTSLSTGSATARSLAVRAADIVNVRDFGAVCDDTADDTAAINAAFSFVRNSRSVGSSIPLVTAQTYAARVVFPQGVCKITAPINITGFKSVYLEIEGSGTAVHCVMSGGVCLDAIGSEWLIVRDLTVIGDSVVIPKIGMQIGRITASAPADNHAFENTKIIGQFTLAAFYNFGAETTEFSHVEFWNFNGAAGTYGLIQDGFNHFAASSTFQSVTAPTDSPVSFNENEFISADLRSIGLGVPLWIGASARHQFIRSYFAGGTTYGAVLYGEGSTNNIMLSVDAHMETTSLTDAFFVTGTNTTPVLNGFAFRDHNFQGSNSVFKTDTNITSVSLRDADIAIASYSGGSVKVFDQPTKWTVTGHYFSPALTQWNAPAQWQGTMSIGGLETWANYGAGFLSAQVPDGTVTGGANRGANSVDWQTTRIANNMAATGANSAIVGGKNNIAFGDSSTASGSGNTASGANSFAGGTSSIAFGSTSLAFGAGSFARGVSAISLGSGVDDHTTFGKLGFSSGDFRVAGDSQIGTHILRGVGATASAFRLTADGSAAGASNCVNISANTAFGLRISLHGRDHTTAGTDYDWYLPNGTMIQDANAASTVVALGTPITLTRGVVTGVSVSTTADTTNGCLNISFTPPTGNTDMWDVTAKVETIEVQ